MKTFYQCPICKGMYDSQEDVIAHEVGSPMMESPSGLCKDEWYTPAEAAEFLGVSQSRIRKWIANPHPPFGHMIDLETDLGREVAYICKIAAHGHTKILIPHRDLLAAERAMMLLGDNARGWGYRGVVYDPSGGVFDLFGAGPRFMDRLALDVVTEWTLAEILGGGTDPRLQG